MKQVISGLRRMQLRQVLTAFLMGLVIFVGAAFGSFGNALQAQAAPAGAGVDEIRANAEQARGKAESAGGGLVESLKETAETVKEKLNLDEPVPDSTKAFLKQVQGEDVEVEEPRPSGKGEVPKDE